MQIFIDKLNEYIQKGEIFNKKWSKYQDDLKEHVAFNRTGIKFGPSNPISLGEEQEWYLNCIALLDKLRFQQLLPLFERIEGYESGRLCQYGEDVKYQVRIAILKSALEQIKMGHLQSIKSIISAEHLSSLFEQAKEFYHKEHKDVAAILCRIIIEFKLRDLCQSKNIEVFAKKGLNDEYRKASDLNIELRMKGIYPQHMERKIQSNLDIGNDAAHDDFNKYTDKEVGGMITFIDDVLLSLK